MVLHKLVGQWQLIPLVTMTGFGLLMLVLGEFTAVMTEHQNSIFQSTHHMHNYVSSWMRSFALPNYWMTYQEEAIFEALEVHREHELPLLVHITWNAALATPALAVLLVHWTMFIAIRSLTKNSFAIKLVGWIPVVAGCFDLVEDFCMLYLLLTFRSEYNFPVALLCSWCSFLKFMLWIGTLLSWAIMLLYRTIFGAPQREHEF